MKKTKKASHNQFRIIGGQWRSRRIDFVDRPGLRPTPDRVRETVFNWLGPGIVGKSCLDLFAGAGALGFEALSRGAAQVTLVDRDAATLAAVKNNLAALNAHHGEAVCADALAYLGQSSHHFDVIFLDPPFASRLIDDCWPLIAAYQPSARIYLEYPRATPPAAPPQGWHVRKSKRAGQVGFALCERDSSAVA